MLAHARRPANRAASLFAFAAGLSVALLSASAFAPSSFDLLSRLEQLVAPARETVAGIPVGRMSPMTAGALLLATTALLCQLPPLSGRRFSGRAGGGLALALLLGSLGIAGGYLSGTPMMYGGQTIPMALLTAVALAVLGLGLLLTDDSVDLVVTVVFGTVGFLYLRRHQLDMHRAKEAELAAFADLKVAQIVAWREARDADARIALESRIIAGIFQRLLNGPPDPTVKSQALNWMNTRLVHRHYARILLLDLDGRVRLAVPAGSDQLDATVTSAAAEAQRTGHVVIADLHAGL